VDKMLSSMIALASSFRMPGIFLCLDGRGGPRDVPEIQLTLRYS